MSANAPFAIELRSITKRFGKLTANDAVNLQINKGEIHTLLGENGAGKSTLMGIAYGLTHPDSGEILIDGKSVTIDSPSSAIEHGIGMVHQHFMLIDVMTVAENIVPGSEPTNMGKIDRTQARKRVLELSQRFGFTIDPDAKVEDLTVGEQQRLEIMRALYRNANVLILDEPTAVLTAQETEDLFKVLRGLKERGTAIIFISHKLKEILSISDHVTVLRRGKVSGSVPTSECNEQSLAEMMVGRDVLLRVAKQEQLTVGHNVLKVKNLVVEGEHSRNIVDDVSFSIRAGEVVAIAGVDGNGQRELVEALTGLRRSVSGTITLDGRDITQSSVRKKTKAGLRYITEDRHARGLVLEMSLADNFILRDFRRTPFSKFGLLNQGSINDQADRLIDEYDIRGGSRERFASMLSGGNQQKIVIGRELDRDPRCLIAAQPTRGLDVGAIEFVHRRILKQRAAGSAIMLVSLELDEIRSLADRILVMYEGQIVGEFSPEASDSELGIAMTGGQTRVSA